MNRYTRASMEVGISEFSIDLFPFLFIVLLVLLAFLKYHKHSLSYLICVFIFGTYLLYALSKVFFPIAISGTMAQDWRAHHAHWSHWGPYLNLRPFPFSGPRYSQDASAYLHTLILNVLLTVPFGFGIHFIRRVRTRYILRLAIGVGLVIEGTQLLISLLLRYPYRVIDINDILMNMLGVLLGFGLFRLFGWLYVWVTQRLNIQHIRLGAYIYDVVEKA
jgi:glycopeptide antibiotics resistance protein